MLNPDFSDRTYTAEVMRAKIDAGEAFKAVLRLTHSPETEVQTDQVTGSTVTVCHAFLPTKRQYHRFPKSIVFADGKEGAIPRQLSVRGQSRNLYDVYIAQCRQHVVIAVPFHELAEEFFVMVDRALVGTNTRYEKLDITRMVMQLGTSGSVSILKSPSANNIAISVTRCHLTYTDQQSRTASIQQIRMNGTNLGASQEYQSLISPVLNPRSSPLTVTPVILGFALSVLGVRKSSATTDRHGNFKLWIAPGLRRLVRIFDLLEALEALKDVALTTSNVPILQSKTIRDAED